MAEEALFGAAGSSLGGDEEGGTEEEDVQKLLDMFDTACWLEKFRDLTPKTHVLRLSREFGDYLLADGVFVEGDEGSTRSGGEGDDASSDEEAEEIEEEDDDDVSYGRRLQGHKKFPELESEIDQAITALGGQIAPKVGTKSPLDAAWMDFNEQTRCLKSSEVILLLKSSDRVSEEVESRIQEGLPLTLSLRKWSYLDPSMEFRVFVKNRHVVAISQRDELTKFDFLLEKLDEVRDLIVNLFSSRIAGSVDASDYVIDIYVDRNGKVWIIDFAPFGEPTDALLYSWEELDLLEVAETTAVEVRIVDQHTMRPAKCMNYGVPYELQGVHGMEALADAAKRLILQEGNPS